MRRFFVSPQTLADDEITLGTEVLHHLSVLRLRPGAEILLLDGEGGHCRCRLESLARGSGTARVLERWRQLETAFPLRLLQALPKGEKLDLVLQKGTELGTAVFSPVLTGRSVPRHERERGERQLERWRRIVAEAARQSGRPCLPGIEPLRSLEEALASTAEELRLLPWEEAALPLAEALPEAAPASAAVLVGPEGGFSREEAEKALAAGFVPVRLGPRILRTETAGLAVAAILQFRYGDMGRGKEVEGRSGEAR